MEAARLLVWTQKIKPWWSELTFGRLIKRMPSNWIIYPICAAAMAVGIIKIAGLTATVGLDKVPGMNTAYWVSVTLLVLCGIAAYVTTKSVEWFPQGICTIGMGEYRYEEVRRRHRMLAWGIPIAISLSTATISVMV